MIKCNSPTCPLRDECYRYTAKESQNQQFINYKSDCSGVEDFPYFWPNGFKRK